MRWILFIEYTMYLRAEACDIYILALLDIFDRSVSYFGCWHSFPVDVFFPSGEINNKYIGEREEMAFETFKISL